MTLNFFSFFADELVTFTMRKLCKIKVDINLYIHKHLNFYAYAIICFKNRLHIHIQYFCLHIFITPYFERELHVIKILQTFKTEAALQRCI